GIHEEALRETKEDLDRTGGHAIPEVILSDDQLKLIGYVDAAAAQCGLRHGKAETRTAPTTPDASSLRSSGNTIKSSPSFILTASSIAEAERSSGTQGRPPCVFPSAMTIPIEIPCVIPKR